MALGTMGKKSPYPMDDFNFYDDRGGVALTGDPDETVGSNLATLVFHQAYHVGQTGGLRRVAGSRA
ncbi:MAG: hypothetical protein ABI703_07410 [Gemmatimonadales bacterium]